MAIDPCPLSNNSISISYVYSVLNVPESVIMEKLPEVPDIEIGDNEIGSKDEPRCLYFIFTWSPTLSA